MSTVVAVCGNVADAQETVSDLSSTGFNRRPVNFSLRSDRVTDISSTSGHDTGAGGTMRTIVGSMFQSAA